MVNNRFLSSAGTHSPSGEWMYENHGPDAGNNVCVIPIGTGAPAVTFNDGELFFVAPSSMLLMSHGGVWKSVSGVKPPSAPPAAVTGLSFHLDAQREADASGYVDGVSVSGATDISASGFDIVVSGATSTYPTFRATGINGLPSFEFDGGDYLRVDQAVRLFDTRFTGQDSEYTVFIVTSPNNLDSTSDNLFSCGNTLVNIYFQSHYHRGVNGWTMAKSDIDENVFISEGASGSITPVYLSFTSHPTSGIVRRDGNVVGSGSTWGNLEEIQLNTLLIAAQDRQTGGVQNFFNGHIGEILVYDSALSDADRVQIEQYIQDRWGL